jgi:hypothetical protein
MGTCQPALIAVVVGFSMVSHECRPYISSLDNVIKQGLNFNKRDYISGNNVLQASTSYFMVSSNIYMIIIQKTLGLLCIHNQ